MLTANQDRIIYEFVILSVEASVRKLISLYNYLSILLHLYSFYHTCKNLNILFHFFFFLTLHGKYFFLICQFLLSISAFLISFIVGSNVKYLILKFQSKESHVEILKIIRDRKLQFLMSYHYFFLKDRKANTQENVADYLVKGKCIRETHEVDIWPHLL